MKKPIFSVLLLMIIISSAYGQDDTLSVFEPVNAIIPSSFGLFDSEELLEISLSFDINYLIKNKEVEEYQDAVLTIHISETDSICEKIKLRSRGNRRKELCSLPPIRLNLKKSGTGYDDLDSMSNLKLVTFCKPDKKYQFYVLKEYLVYKLYNLFTEYSFKVRLLQVNYINTGKKGRSYTRYGFIIEPVKMLEKRLNAIELDHLPIRDRNIDNKNADRVSIFQYMVGNTDWHINSQHNLKIFKPFEKNTALCIPYDFDYTGLVYTEYAAPREEFGTEDVRIRFYMGFCREDEEYNTALLEFIELKQEIMDTINQFPYLVEGEKKKVVKYLESFYKLYDKGVLPSRFNRFCKTL